MISVHTCSPLMFSSLPSDGSDGYGVALCAKLHRIMGVPVANADYPLCIDSPLPYMGMHPIHFT